MEPEGAHMPTGAGLGAASAVGCTVEGLGRVGRERQAPGQASGAVAGVREGSGR